jgi:hypothetical protein
MTKLVRESLNERNLYRDERPSEPLTTPANYKPLRFPKMAQEDDELSPLERLHQSFEGENFEVDPFNEDDNGFWVENENGVRAFITSAGGDMYFDILVQGMSEDVPISDIQFDDVIDIFADLDEEWLKENDPEGDQY